MNLLIFMFSGIIEKLGIVKKPLESGRTLSVEAGFTASPGDSISVNGVCLTVTKSENDILSFDVLLETIKKTNLHELKSGSKVNIERPLKVSGRLHGHFVYGHIDGVGKIIEKQHSEGSEKIWIRCGKEVTDLLVKKGSVAVDGVGLTIIDLDEGKFSVECTPTTLQGTTLGFKQKGDSVNIETDVIARYVKKFLSI